MTALGPIDADNLRLILPRAETRAEARPWRTGQLIRALVIEVLAGDRVLLEIGGRRLEAETQVPLQNGQTLQARVAELSDKVVLRLLGGGPAAGYTLENLGREFLSRRAELTGALQALAGEAGEGRPADSPALAGEGRPADSPALVAVRALLQDAVLTPDKLAQGRVLVRELQTLGRVLGPDQAASLARDIRQALVQGQRPETVGRLVEEFMTRAGVEPERTTPLAARLVTALAGASAGEPGRALRAAVELLAGGPELAAVRAARAATAEAKEGTQPRAASLKAGLEQTLATDLKTMVHRLAPLPADAADRTPFARKLPAPDQALAGLARALQTGLDSQQALTHHVWRQDQALLLFLPLVLDGRWSLIEFFVRRDGRTGRQAEDETGTNLALFLEMSNLGPVRVDARVRPGRITCRFTVTEPPAAEALRRDFDQVAGRLEALGYRTELLGVFVKAADEVESLSPLVEKLTGQDTGFHVVV